MLVSARAGMCEVHKRIPARAALTNVIIGRQRGGGRGVKTGTAPPTRPLSYKGGREVSGKGDRLVKFIAGWSPSPEGVPPPREDGRGVVPSPVAQGWGVAVWRNNNS